MNKSKNNYTGYDELVLSESMSNYNFSIVKGAISYAKPNGKVIDFGAGIGTLTSIFKKKFNINCIAVEIDKKNIEILKKRNLTQVDSMDLVDGNVDLIFSSNVLEHIKDDVAVLKKMKKKLTNRGMIYLYLPAKMILWSSLDEKVGHYRRYELKEIKEKCKKVGLIIDSLYYSDSIGFFASMLMKFMGYNPAGGIGSKNSLIFYDKFIYPISKILDFFGLKYLFGKNLILIARK